MYFHVRRSVTGQWTVVHVTGEIDLATAPAYRAELIGVIQQSDHITVDLSDCDLIDSVGLGLTLGGARRVTEAGGVFVVVVSDRVRRLFERCRLHEVLTLVGSLDELDGAGTAPGTAATLEPVSEAGP